MKKYLLVDWDEKETHPYDDFVELVRDMGDCENCSVYEITVDTAVLQTDPICGMDDSKFWSLN